MINPTNPDFTNTPISHKRPRFGYSLVDVSVPPYVTIITPFYNTGSIFYETARSVLQQSFQQWEWLIVNDGSIDPESLSILEDYRHKDPRIQIIDHSTNQGLSAARNTGFRAARTQYVLQLDSDDLLEPTAVEKWCWFLESYPEFAFGKGYSVGFGALEYLWDKGFHNVSAFLDENLVDATCMIRKAVHQAVGGYDEANRGGLEDCEFWLRCASFGYWGGTVPEYLDWYRRRPTHSDRWPNVVAERLRAFQMQFRRKYPRLWEGNFPQIQPRLHVPNDIVPDELPCENRLRKDKPRLLMVVPWLTLGGSDKFNLDLIQQLTQQGWEVTIATTLQGDHSWLPQFARYTPDIFILHHFLRLVDYPRFLRYLIHSRQVDVVMISHSEMGYLLLPYLRTHFPDVTFVDFCHIEEEYWKNGGYPRMAVEYQELLDLNIVSSHHLKSWMTRRGADHQRVYVCYTNIDTEEWCPDPEQRLSIRQELGLDDTIPLVLYAGRICAKKQPRVFAKTMLRLHQQGLHFVALVAGDGPDLKWLRSFIDKHKLNDQVHLHGAVSHQRIKQLMAAADVFFLPSQWEGIAFSIYEAMACGLPVVGANVGGQREPVTPECGVLIERSDEETEAQRYAEALSELLKDPKRCREIGAAGRARVSVHFRLEQMREGMVALLGRAGNLHATQSRPQPGLGLGRACAALAVEYTRLFQVSEYLWNTREHIIREQQAWLGEIEDVKPWSEERLVNGHQLTIASRLQQNQKLLEEQRDNWQRLAEDRWRQVLEQQTWIGELQKGKAWLEEQWNNWQRIAAEREQMIQKQQVWIGELEKGKELLKEQREQLIREQQAWIGDLEKGKAWLEEQWNNWQRIAEEREQMIQKQQVWIGELERGKMCLEEQLATLEKERLFWQSVVAQWQDNLCVRLGLRLGILKQPSIIQREVSQEVNQ